MSSHMCCAGLAQLFAALADRTRLRLLNLMRDRELCVCYLVEVLRMSQPKVSRHLAYLRRAGVVAARREGRWMHYRLATADPAVGGILRAILEALASDPQFERDHDRLTKACCAPAKFIKLRGAPTPSQADPGQLHGT